MVYNGYEKYVIIVKCRPTNYWARFTSEKDENLDRTCILKMSIGTNSLEFAIIELIFLLKKGHRKWGKSEIPFNDK